MTFLEAAIEVLRREGKPATGKQLADLAVKYNLLSVVGRDPEGTMEARLDDALSKNDPRLQLLLIRPGLYGLRSYPAQPYPPPGEAKAVVVEEPAKNGDPAAAKPGEERSGRRRRSRRGRGGKRDESAAPASDPLEAEADSDGDDAEPAEAAAASGEAAASGAAAAGEEPKRSRRSRRRGGRGRRRGERQPGAESGGAAAAPAGDDDRDEALPSESEGVAEALEAQAAGLITVEELPASAEPGAAADEGGEPDSELLLAGAPAEADAEAAEGDQALDGEEHEFDLPSGPLMAPSHGAEEMTRSGEERAVRAEIQGRRGEERGRRFRGGRDRKKGQQPAPQHGQPQPRSQPLQHAQQRPPQPQQPAGGERDRDRDREREHERPSEAPRAEARTEGQSLLESILDLLRSSDGRPMHVRVLTDLAMKRHLVDGRGSPAEVSRLIRTVLLRERREREADGLRARVRGAGGGHYVLADRKLDQELQPLERELGERAQRLREATRNAVRRRVQRLAPPAFEALGRALAEKLGLQGLELVRRGEGVAYYGGQRTVGVATVRALIALRPGEAELTRRAVGELRAGLQVRGFDQGLLFAGGRAGVEALAELKASPTVEAHDGASLAALCIRHGLGVRRVMMPVDYLDVDFFVELTEG